MSKKANPTAIGLFVIIGAALLVGGVLLFSSSRIFSTSRKCIIYFDSTLSGLNEGAPVKFRGVTVGSVSQVMIRYNQATNDSAMPVIIELEQDLIHRRIVGPSAFQTVGQLNEEVRRGIRAKLETESLLTGLLFVELEREESPPPAVYHQLTPLYVEIPSRPSDTQELMRKLAKLDLDSLQHNLNGLIKRADNLLANLDMKQINSELTNLLGSATGVVRNPNLTNSFASLKSTLDEYRLLGQNVDTNTLRELNSALEDFRGGMGNLRDTLSADSELRNQLDLTLSQLTDAAESVSGLADYLHNHPNSLLFGRKPVSQKTQ